MRTFIGRRKTSDIVAQCRKKKWKVDMTRYAQGSDHIMFEFRHKGVSLCVLYNTFNGRAFGTLSKWGDRQDYDKKFDTDKTDDENQPWFQALLEFIYIPKPSRWNKMSRKPKGARNLFLKGSDGKVYHGSYVSGTLFSKAPDRVKLVGWRLTAPN